MIWQDTVIVFLDILFYFCHYLSPLHLLLGSFYWLVSQFTDYFLDSVQSTDDPRGALQFCYSVFSFFESFLDFPSLCLHYLLVIVLCPLFPLVNMMLCLWRLWSFFPLSIPCNILGGWGGLNIMGIEAKKKKPFSVNFYVMRWGVGHCKN